MHCLRRNKPPVQFHTEDSVSLLRRQTSAEPVPRRFDVDLDLCLVSCSLVDPVLYGVAPLDALKPRASSFNAQGDEISVA